MDPKVGESYYLDRQYTCDPYRGEPITIVRIIDSECVEITFHAHPEWDTKWANPNQLSERIPLVVPVFTTPTEAQAWLDANSEAS